MKQIQLTLQTKLVLIGLFAILAVLLITSNSANPDALTYGLKRIQEKLFLDLKFSPQQKLNYYDLLLTRRLQELSYLTTSKQTTMLWSSSLRYTTTAGEATDLIVKNDLKDRAGEFINRFKQDQIAINNLLINYPGDVDPKQENYKFLTDAKNYLQFYIEKLSTVR